MSNFTVDGWSPVGAVKNLGHTIEQGAGDIAGAVGKGVGGVEGAAAKLLGEGGDSQYKDTAPSTSKTKDLSKAPTANPAPSSIPTEGLKEGQAYTYKNGKLTPYSAPATTGYGFDPLSMQSIFSTSVAPYLNSLNKQISASDASDTAALKAAEGTAAAEGVSPAALSLIGAGNTAVLGADKSSTLANEASGVAAAPFDALITQLGQAADAARLAGYESEYGQATSGSSGGGLSAAQLALLSSMMGTGSSSASSAPS
jgi:hypothetical protein